MTLVDMVEDARKKAGIRQSTITTISGATGIVADLLMWVQDAWVDLQKESLNWWFRTKIDDTISIIASTDQYAMPADLETINWRTCSIYTTVGVDEASIRYIPYEEWRMRKDLYITAEGRPTLITERPDTKIHVWPFPDQAYTLRYDGVYAIDNMTADADTPGDTISVGTQLLPDQYHEVIVWDAVRRYATQHEDGPTLERSQKQFLAAHARLKERHAPDIYVKPGILTGRKGYVSSANTYWR
jgi:hypothetical protein